MKKLLLLIFVFVFVPNVYSYHDDLDNLVKEGKCKIGKKVETNSFLIDLGLSSARTQSTAQLVDKFEYSCQNVSDYINDVFLTNIKETGLATFLGTYRGIEGSIELGDKVYARHYRSLVSASKGSDVYRMVKEYKFGIRTGSWVISKNGKIVEVIEISKDGDVETRNLFNEKGELVSKLVSNRRGATGAYGYDENTKYTKDDRGTTVTATTVKTDFSGGFNNERVTKGTEQLKDFYHVKDFINPADYKLPLLLKD